MSDAVRRLAAIARRRRAGERAGIASICSAHPVVIEAALLHGLRHERDVLIEATCNQVNQDGGYTGMTPADFRRFVEGIAIEAGFPLDRLILGGDHLGPNPWKSLPAEAAMAKAETMVSHFAAAGFAKLHLDTSMGCAGEPAALDDATTAERAARLAAFAERAAEDAKAPSPVYVIGTEVPVPGGALHALDDIAVTNPDAARRTVEIHAGAFAAEGIGAAFDRVIGLVVQPGVEFGNAEVVVYDRGAAATLSRTLDSLPQFVFEAHSTDYQPEAALSRLLDDGFVILKVGPWLTFALREALYGLSSIADVLDLDGRGTPLPAVMEHVMLASPEHWLTHYPGSAAEQHVERHFSFSDRIRYYWPSSQAREAVAALEARLGERRIPVTLVSQYLAHLYPAVTAGTVAPLAHNLLLASITRILDLYDRSIYGQP